MSFISDSVASAADSDTSYMPYLAGSGGSAAPSAPSFPPSSLAFKAEAAEGMREPEMADDGYDSETSGDKPLSARRAEKRPETEAAYGGSTHTGHSRQLSQSVSTGKPAPTLANFTEKTDWAWNIIEDVQDWMHVMGPEGNILFAAPSIRPIAGYSPDDVVGRNLDAFIHHDDVNSFNRDMRLAVSTGMPLRHHYRLRKKDGRYVIFEVVGHAHYGAGNVSPAPEQCKCIFALARPYPSRQAEELDSFLEAKIENELLRQEIERMRLEVANDEEARSALEQLQKGRPAAKDGHEASSKPRPPHSGGKAFSGIGNTHKSVSASDDKRRRKKQRIEEGEFMCRDCGTVDSPEWRKGPMGPKTLCNACGLRWAKKAKQMQGRAS